MFFGGMRFSLLLSGLLSAAAENARRPTISLDKLNDYSFDQYIVDFGKVYPDSAEFSMRQAVFNSRFTDVLRHNAGPSTYKRGINHFSDMTDEEIKIHAFGYKRGSSSDRIQAGLGDHPTCTDDFR